MVGVLLDAAELRESLLGSMSECSEDNVDCYLLDDAGLLLLSSNEEHDKDVSRTNSNSHYDLSQI